MSGDPQPPRRIPDLSRKIGQPLESLAFEYFAKDPESGFLDKLGKAMDMSRFEAPEGEATPRSNGGRIAWGLRPKDRRTVADLDELVNAALTRCSPWERMLVERREGISKIAYKFLLTTGVQAHMGTLEFSGDAVRQALEEKRAPRADGGRTP